MTHISGGTLQTAPEELVAEQPVSPWRRIVEDFCENRLALAGLVTILIIGVVAAAAPWIAPQNPYDLRQLDIMDGRLVPGSTSLGTGMKFWLGTDDQGRDMLSGILYGLRISLVAACFWASFRRPRSHSESFWFR